MLIIAFCHEFFDTNLLVFLDNSSFLLKELKLRSTDFRVFWAKLHKKVAIPLDISFFVTIWLIRRLCSAFKIIRSSEMKTFRMFYNNERFSIGRNSNRETF